MTADSYRRYCVDDYGEDKISEWDDTQCIVYVFCIEELGYDSVDAFSIVNNMEFHFYSSEYEFGENIFDFLTADMPQESRNALYYCMDFVKLAENCMLDSGFYYCNGGVLEIYN